METTQALHISLRVDDKGPANRWILKIANGSTVDGSKIHADAFDREAVEAKTLADAKLASVYGVQGSWTWVGRAWKLEMAV